MSEIKSIVVNEKTYRVQMMSVLDTIDLHVETVACMGGVFGKLASIFIDIKNNKKLPDGTFAELFSSIKPESIREIKKKVLAQVYTPENRILGDEMTIENWFSRPENKGDVWEVLVKATMELLGEYLPGFLRDIMTKGIAKATMAQLKSQNDSDERQ